jgi:hypothetical protein
MPFRFQRRIRLGPFLHFNLSKSGVSTTVGTRGLHATFGQRGTRLSAGIPGSGLSVYSESHHVAGEAVPHDGPRASCELPACNPAMVPVGKAVGFILIGGLALLVLLAVLVAALG